MKLVYNLGESFGSAFKSFLKESQPDKNCYSPLVNGNDEPEQAKLKLVKAGTTVKKKRKVKVTQY
jgi:hypothetical protein